MWNLLTCYLSGLHDFGVWCEPGTIFLRCVHCGKRSSGWAVKPKAPIPLARPRLVVVSPLVASVRPRVLPFDRTAAAR